MIPQLLRLIQIGFTDGYRARALSAYGPPSRSRSRGCSLAGCSPGADLFGLTWRTVFLFNDPTDIERGMDRVAIPVAQATGRPVIGVDSSPSMLDQARENARAAGVISISPKGHAATSPSISQRGDHRFMLRRSRHRA